MEALNSSTNLIGTNKNANGNFHFFLSIHRRPPSLRPNLFRNFSLYRVKKRNQAAFSSSVSLDPILSAIYMPPFHEKEHWQRFGSERTQLSARKKDVPVNRLMKMAYVKKATKKSSKQEILRREVAVDKVWFYHIWRSALDRNIMPDIQHSVCASALVLVAIEPHRWIKGQWDGNSYPYNQACSHHDRSKLFSTNAHFLPKAFLQYFDTALP